MLDQFVAESKRLQPAARLGLPEHPAPQLPEVRPAGAARVADAIPMAKRVGVQVILLPFFGRALKTTAEMDYVGDC